MDTIIRDALPLPSPQLPQMSVDNVIDAADLQADDGVLIVSNEPGNSAQGDYLTLFWNGTPIDTMYIDTSDPSECFPWETLLPSRLVPDGVYQVYYTRLDVHGNPPAVSSFATAIVRRSDTGPLPAPDFPEASNNEITSDDLTDGSTTVHIPIWPDMTAGDEVTIYWVGADIAGNTVPESITSQSHIVESEDISSGFTVQVAASFVSVIGTGSASAWYSVLPISGGLALNSQTATVQIDISQTSLPAPSFPEGGDGWIDASEASDGTPVAIPAYPGMAVGDVVIVNWQGYAGNVPVDGSGGVSSPHTVSAADLATGFQVAVPYANLQPIGIGLMQAWYQVTFAGDTGQGVSATATVNVDTTHTQVLPPPVFPAASGDNTITSDEVAAEDGTSMEIAYPDMTVGDAVTAFWVGYISSPDTPVSGTTWTGYQTLTETEVQAQQVVFHIPAENITPVGNGHGEGRYQVMFKNSGIASSSVTDVNVSVSASSSLQMNCTTGAPIFDPAVLIRPFNSVFLTGPAGTDVEISLPGGSDAWFDPDGVQTLQIRLDAAGTASVQVYSFSPGNVLVSAYAVSNPLLNASQSMTFTNWLMGTGDLQSYGTSTGALANGTCICSVYLLTSDTSQAAQARLKLNNISSAIISSSQAQTAFVNVSSSHAGGFDVTDTVVESVAFNLSLPDTGDYIEGTLVFTALPQTREFR